MHPVRCMPVIILIAVFIFAPLSHQREDEECGLDFTTVVVKKARGRLGNHVWLIMTMINYELKYGVKAYITEESRWILNEYFKGFDEETYPTAEKRLCGFPEYHKTWEYYLDTKIINYYETVSGVKLAIDKPKSKFATNMINIPPEIGLKYPKPDTVAWVDSEEFIANEPKNFKVENCPYTWNIFREYPDELGNRAINNAYIINPSGRLREDGKFFSTPELAKKLRNVLQLKDAFVSNAESKLQKVKKKFKNQEKEFVFVGIHSRRTDHLAYQHKRGQIPLQPSYYLDAMAMFKKKFPSKKYNLAFIYVSDDPDWGKERIATKKGSKNLYFVGNPTDEFGQYDLALLASCNHTIQSYGSYTFFAGFLAGGLKIVPQHFAEYRTKTEGANATKFLKKNPLDNPLPELYFFDYLF